VLEDGVGKLPAVQQGAGEGHQPLRDEAGARPKERPKVKKKEIVNTHPRRTFLQLEIRVFRL
jgi:hypothetical protein